MDLSKFKMRVTPTHVYFWGGPFSQWHKSYFEAELPILAAANDGKPQRLVRSGRKYVFSSGEKYMMAAKASVFGDTGKGSVLEKIMGSDVLFDETDHHAPGYQQRTDDPAKVKALGRSVPGLKGGKWDDDDIALWGKVSMPIVTIGSLSKFAQTDELYDVLMSMGTREFVEGSPKDDIWGVKLAYNNPLIDDRANWKGMNKLGIVLNTTSDILVEHGRDIDPWQVLSYRHRRLASQSQAPTF